MWSFYTFHLLWFLELLVLLSVQRLFIACHLFIWRRCCRVLQLDVLVEAAFTPIGFLALFTLVITGYLFCIPSKSLFFQCWTLLLVVIRAGIVHYYYGWVSQLLYFFIFADASRHISSSSSNYHSIGVVGPRLGILSEFYVLESWEQVMVPLLLQLQLSLVAKSVEIPDL